MSNFTFLQTEWPDLHASARKAEALVHTDTRTTCFYARRTLELAVDWLYQNDSELKRPYDNHLSALIYEPTFKDNLPKHIFLKVRAIKEIGNQAVHSNRPITEADALRATQELFHFLYWLAHRYTRRSTAEYQGLNFDETQVPARRVSVPVHTFKQLQAMAEELKARDAEAAKLQQVKIDTDAEILRLREEIAEAKRQNQLVPDTHDYSEAETRNYFIDLMLHEAGWPLDKPEDREYEVAGMPNAQNKGFVDYVLWGDDGRPLALVEAKRTAKDPRIGQEQARLYANCLEQKFGRRPIIFYSSGYTTWLWDDLNYPPREVQGFYKKDELELLVQRRTTRKDLNSEPINKEIVERHYQEASIRRVVEEFSDNNQRKALIVMATGAGKTRTVIALCELLQRCNWIKRVLFLADRVALVKQAANAFKKHLPDSSPVNLVTDKKETGSRVYLSTYPTMMNLINDMDLGLRRLGVGHFDLVVIDEAHRSVYQKYRAIFEYFDSYLIGLTATPKSEVDKNTYGLFDLEKGVPTYSYELEEAVKDGYLVPSVNIEVPGKFQREGIKYDELSEEEKEEWEAIDWDEEGNIPEKVEATALNKWLFNEDTVDKVLESLMTRGLKVVGGDRLGKTIIFAKNHDHAVFIQERFDKQYPKLKGEFARVIDHQTTYAESLIDDFSTMEKPPHIAVSVDMLDTGIDIPEIVNLVFFKVLRSKTKFLQMIGRGTRLRPDLFGPGQDKECFFIFDYCQNFEFFNQNKKGVEAATQPSLGKQIFLKRLELLSSVRKADSSNEGLKQLGQEIAGHLQTEVSAMNVDNFVVRPHRQAVEKYSEEEAWEDLGTTDYAEVAHIFAGLPTELEPEDETAKRFDLLILKIQLALIQASKEYIHLHEQVKEIARRLEDKQTIPMVYAQMELIEELQQENYWQDITLPMLENVRRRLRDLVKFMDKKARKIIYTDFEDELSEPREVILGGLVTTTSIQYKKKMMNFLISHEDHIVLHKLKNNVPITRSDVDELKRLLFESGDVGTEEDFAKAYGKQEHLGLFIRSLVGLNREAAKKAFSDYLNDHRFNSRQIAFINLIIDYLSQNGVIEPSKLYEPPYTDFNTSGLDGVFQDKDANRIVDIIRTIRTNAAA
ncbi:MAG TPA: DEAD/DEAH box helicase family protein [Pyrinomonadaceae bacterium]|nr:DEAD/DEAH box helicase family protein [Pyrinomonadaceae bacterium]